LYQHVHDMNENELRIEVLLTLQVALLGEVPEALRGITCDWNESQIVIHCYFDGEIAEEDRESMEDVVAEVIASFLEHEVILDCIRKDMPEPLNPLTLKAWVYRRREQM